MAQVATVKAGIYTFLLASKPREITPDVLRAAVCLDGEILEIPIDRSLQIVEAYSVEGADLFLVTDDGAEWHLVKKKQDRYLILYTFSSLNGGIAKAAAAAAHWLRAMTLIPN